MVTARFGNAVEVTKRWVPRTFPGVFKDILFTGNPTLTPEQPSKGEICKANRVELLVDDDFRNAQGCLDAGVGYLLFDQPWNRSYEKVARARDWKEVAGKIREIGKKD